MKKIIILIALFTFLFFQNQAQTINYFDNNPVWSVHSLDTWTPCHINENFNYYLNGDTLINSNLYKKVFKKGIATVIWADPNNPSTPDCSDNSYIDTIPYAFIRQDAKKILKWNVTTNSEKIIYDFNKTVGDTIFSGYSGNLIIDAVGNILINNSNRRLFRVHGYGTTGTCADSVIEGIGTNHGLFELCDGLYYTSKLTCYSINNISYYPSSGQNCNIVVGITKHEIKYNNDFNLYPNPSSDKIIIDFPEQQNAKFQIYSLIGNCVLQGILTGKTNDLNISSLPKGIYIIKITGVDWTKQRKLTKS